MYCQVGLRIVNSLLIQFGFIEQQIRWGDTHKLRQNSLIDRDSYKASLEFQLAIGRYRTCQRTAHIFFLIGGAGNQFQLFGRGIAGFLCRRYVPIAG